MSTVPQLEEVVAILRRHLPSPEYHAVLFGSRAHGKARPASDWDIGVLGPQRMRGAVIQAIRDDLEALRTLHTYDVVDLTTVPSTFREQALRHAIRLV